MLKKTFPAPSLLKMKRVTTHPGEILLEEILKPLDMSAAALAKKIGVSANRLTEIIGGRRSVTADTAIRLSGYLGTTPQFWMNMQSMHDLTSAFAEKRETYEKIVPRDRESAT